MRQALGFGNRRLAIVNKLDIFWRRLTENWHNRSFRLTTVNMLYIQQYQWATSINPG
jgi:hypothetical protein